MATARTVDPVPLDDRSGRGPRLGSRVGPPDGPPAAAGKWPAVLTAIALDRCNTCRASVRVSELVRVVSRDAVTCLACAGLDGLELLPSGDVAMTRRTQALSARVAAVIGWSLRSKRWERRGTLAEPAAIAEARRLCDADARERERSREIAAGRREVEQREYLGAFRAAVVRLFPGCPRAEAAEIAAHACEKHSGRVGRTAAAKELNDEMVRLAVIAHVRHLHTSYDQTIDRTKDKRASRAAIWPDLREVLAAWQRGEPAPGARG